MESLARSPDARLILSQLSLIEIESVFAIKVRTGILAKADLDPFRGLFFADLANGRFEVVLLARRHFQAAEGLIRAHAVDHALRTLDALQLSVALDLKRRGVAPYLVTSDKNLCDLGALEGFTILDPTQTG